MEFIEISFAAVLLLLALVSIRVGLRILITKRPFVVAARWFFIFSLLLYLPFLFGSLVFLTRTPFEFVGWGIIIGLFAFSVSLVFLWFQTKGYDAIGITEDSFRAAILSALNNLKLDYEESLNQIKIISLGIDLQVSIQSSIGVAQIRTRQPNGRSILRSIVNEIIVFYEASATTPNYFTVVFYIVGGLLFASGAFYFYKYFCEFI